MAKKPNKQRLEEILKDGLPSCGTHTADELPDSTSMDFLVTMTLGEWRALGGDE